MIEQIETKRIFLRKDARAIDDAAVSRLADSISDIGVLNPLRVRPVMRMVDGVESDAYEVTAGGHRLKAAIKIGLDAVPCIVAGDDDLHAELAMIDENLMRAELSAVDRAVQTARRKAIYEELHPETVNGENQHTRVRQLGEGSIADRFTVATAAAIGKSERSIQRDAERGEKVCDEAISLIRGTELDTGAYLDKLKGVDRSEQVPAVQRALSGIAKRHEQERAEDIQARSQAKIEADIKDRAAKEIAALLAEHLPADFWDGIKANLAVTTTAKILGAFTNLTGHSIMDAAE